MVISNKRQARYIATPKGKAASLRSKLKSQKNKRMTAKGRLELRIIRIKSTWGSRIAEWFEKQKSVCKICGKTVHKAPENSKDKKNQAVIDHDHKTGKLRGLLCHQCNVGIGNFKDSIDRMLNAILYLSRNSS